MAALATRSKRLSAGRLAHGFSSLLRTKRLSDWCTVQLWLRLEVVAMYFLRISLWTPSRTPWTCRSLNIDATTRAMSFCSSSNLNQGNNDWPCNLSILQCDRYFGMCITANDIPYVLVNDPVDSSHALVTILKTVFLCSHFHYEAPSPGMATSSMHQLWLQRCWEAPRFLENAKTLGFLGFRACFGKGCNKLM